MDREYLKRVLIYFVVSVVAIGVAVYVGYHMVQGFITDVETQPAYLDKFSESLTLGAYVMRRERVVLAGETGTVNYLVKNGEKVAVGDELADICRGGGDGVRERIEELDRRIAELTEVETSAAYSSMTDAASMESDIRDMIIAVSGRMADGDIASASSTSELMLKEMNKRAIVTGQTDGFADEIAALTAEREALTSELTDVARTVRTDISAYFFYDVDGYEDAFAFDDIDEVTLDGVYAMTEAEPTAIPADAVGKLVDDYKWYIAVPTDRETALYFDEGGYYDVQLGVEKLTLSMTLRRVLTVSGGGPDSRACLIFECVTMPEDFEYTRLMPATVTVNEYEGYRVPLQAVRVMNYDGVDVYGVYILYGSTVYFRRIEIVLSQDGYVLCDSHAGEIVDDDGYASFPSADGVFEDTETSPPASYESVPYLQLYDMVVVSARGLYDGKIVRN